jgi:hypothetical protein
LQAQDLKAGNLTAPVLFALRTEQYGPELRSLISQEFYHDEELRARAVELVRQSGGIEKSRQLARKYADAVCTCVSLAIGFGVIKWCYWGERESNCHIQLELGGYAKLTVFTSKHGWGWVWS